MGDLSEIQVIEGKARIPYDRYAAWTPICQLTITTFKISFMTTEVSDASKGSVDNFATRIEPVPAEGPSYRRIEG
jgi:hypothetical protein